ncbi:MAG: hypothetical protein UY10_C0018G0005 [Microgenomates group bacterium GW2011_GWA2_47_8]|nr:MAG: hypothetical protein UY10_C0018G0005 [Microgenomates group bacterium GW2011_GWA2_47_8]
MSLLAQLRNPVLPPSIGGAKGATEKTGGTALGSIIGGIVGMLFIAGFLLAFLTLLMGALNWITAGGDKTKLEAARNQITNAIVGVIIVGAAYAITSLLANFFGFNLESLPIPTVGQ